MFDSEPTFTTSRTCDSGGCVEVAMGDTILVRNSTEPDKIVGFTQAEWRVFVEGVRLGDFAVE